MPFASPKLDHHSIMAIPNVIAIEYLEYLVPVFHGIAILNVNTIPILLQWPVATEGMANSASPFRPF